MFGVILCSSWPSSSHHALIIAFGFDHEDEDAYHDDDGDFGDHHEDESDNHDEDHHDTHHRTWADEREVLIWKCRKDWSAIGKWLQGPGWDAAWGGAGCDHSDADGDDGDGDDDDDDGEVLP